MRCTSRGGRCQNPGWGGSIAPRRGPADGATFAISTVRTGGKVTIIGKPLAVTPTLAAGGVRTPPNRYKAKVSLGQSAREFRDPGPTHANRNCLGNQCLSRRAGGGGRAVKGYLFHEGTNYAKRTIVTVPLMDARAARGPQDIVRSGNY